MNEEPRFDTHRVLFREWLELTCKTGCADFQEMNRLCQDALMLCQDALMNLSGAESAARFYRNQLNDAEKWLKVALNKLHMSLGDLEEGEE